MSTRQVASFFGVTLHGELDLFSDEGLDGVDFAVVEINVNGVVQRYNSFECRVDGLSSQRVLGQSVLTVVDAEVKRARPCRRKKAGQMGTLNLTDKRRCPLLSP